MAFEPAFFVYMMMSKRIGHSQEKIQLCADKLGPKMNEHIFEHIHRLGKHTGRKQRLITFKLAPFKKKEHILSCVQKLKGRSTSIHNNFSPETQDARRKLIEFAKKKNKAVSFSVDKLYIHSTTYIYDSAESAIVPLDSSGWKHVHRVS